MWFTGFVIFSFYKDCLHFIIYPFSNNSHNNNHNHDNHNHNNHNHNRDDDENENDNDNENESKNSIIIQNFMSNDQV